MIRQLKKWTGSMGKSGMSSHKVLSIDGIMLSLIVKQGKIKR